MLTQGAEGAVEHAAQLGVLIDGASTTAGGRWSRAASYQLMLSRSEPRAMS